MSAEPVTSASAFRLDDLAVFDEAHLRELIAARSGAILPAQAGRAFATEWPRTQQALATLAARIERALSPTDRATFAEARQEHVPAAEHKRACQAILDNLYW